MPWAPIFQYQQLAEPILVPSAAAEPTVDQWLPSYPPRTSDRPPLVSTGESVLQPLSELIFLDKWSPSYPDFARASKPLVPTGEVTPPNPELIFLDKWAPTYPDFARASKPLVPTGEVTPPNPELIFLDKWTPTYPDIVPRGAQPLVATGLHILEPLFELIFSDKWTPDYADFAQRSALRPVSTGTHILEPLFEQISLDKWSPVYPTQIKGAILAAAWEIILPPIAPILVAAAPEAAEAVPSDGGDEVFPKRIPLAPFPRRFFTDKGFPTTAHLSISSLDIAHNLNKLTLTLSPYIEERTSVGSKETALVSLLYQDQPSASRLNIDHTIINIPIPDSLSTAFEIFIQHEIASYKIPIQYGIVSLVTPQSTGRIAIEETDIIPHLTTTLLDHLTTGKENSPLLTSVMSSYTLTHEKNRENLDNPRFISSVILPAVIRAYLELKGGKI